MRVIIEGHGVYELSEEKLPQLLAILSSGVKVQESNSVYERNDDGFTGRSLLSE